MSRRQPKRNGFTLIELVLATGIFGAVILGVSTALVTFKKTEQFRKDRFLRGTDFGFGEAAVLMDLADASPSFSVLKQLDDNGDRFFDYYPDVPDARLAGWGVTRKTRILTLTSANNRTFKTILIDRIRKPGVKINPALAYSYAGGSTTTTGAATYVGLNAGNILSDRAPPLFWTTGAGVLLICPAFQRPILPVNQTVNYGYPPKTHVFPGFVNGNDLTYRGDWDGDLDLRLPTDTSRMVDSADKFLWWLPTVGGASVYSLAVPVQFTRLRIVSQASGRLDSAGQPIMMDVLVREEWNGTGYSPPFAIAQWVKRVILRRESISSPLIGVTFEMLNPSM